MRRRLQANTLHSPSWPVATSSASFLCIRLVGAITGSPRLGWYSTGLRSDGSKELGVTDRDRVLVVDDDADIRKSLSTGWTCRLRRRDRGIAGGEMLRQIHPMRLFSMSG